MIPKTSDGRVMFGVPWHGKVVLGTTDTPMKDFVLEPQALEEEVEFILKTAGQYLSKTPAREDVLSVFAGLRPLAAPKKESDSRKTKEISRSHKIEVSDSGLVTITGGKWTTYRQMAEDAVDRAIKATGLLNRKCVTRHLKIHGWQKTEDRTNFRYVYGTDYAAIREIENEKPEYATLLDERTDVTGGMVAWAVREEMALTLEDVLARRLRVLFTDARAAIDMAPRAAAVIASERGMDAEWARRQVEEFTALAQNYLLVPYRPAHRDIH